MNNDAFYEDLMKQADSIKNEEDFNGVDAFLGDKIKVASLDRLQDFFRIGGTNKLVHKAQKDLWRVGEDKNGEFVIERLFDPESKEPIHV